VTKCIGATPKEGKETEVLVVKKIWVRDIQKVTFGPSSSGFFWKACPQSHQENKEHTIRCFIKQHTVVFERHILT